MVDYNICIIWFIYLCLTCFNLFFFCLILTFFFLVEDADIGGKIKINLSSQFFPACPQSSVLVFLRRLSSRPQSPPFIQSGYSTDTELSNRTWAICGNLLMCTWLLFFFDALLFLWMFVFHAERTKLRLPSARWSWTKRCSNLLNFPRLFISMCSCSPHVTSVLKKKKSRKPQVTFDLRQSRWSCSCWPGAELEVTQDE